jgi:hypothetical protein
MAVGAALGVWILVRDFVLYPKPISKGEVGTQWDFLPHYLVGTAVLTAIGGVLGVVAAIILGGKKRR